jgi:catalase
MGLQVWPTDQFPLRQIGRLVLDTNIENFHNENEQIAFSPGRVVPGNDVPTTGLRVHIVHGRVRTYSRATTHCNWCFPRSGITYSNDKVLQSRINAYQDTQRYRIGVK